jgi:hypothetical protein
MLDSSFYCSPYVTTDCLNIINIFKHFFFAKKANYTKMCTSGFDGAKVVIYGSISAP